MDLPYPVFFRFGRLDQWRDIVETDPVPDPDEMPLRINRGGGEAAWVMQTYLRLKRRGLNVHIRERFVADSICVAHYDDITLKKVPFRSFIVAIQPDRPRPYMCDSRVVQNGLWVRSSEEDFLIPFWRQPGLIRRDPARGGRVERVGFLGRPMYLAAPFRSEAFAERLREIGMELVVKDREWYDYSDLDAILAVRDVTDFDLSVKPAGKLVNAWHGGCIPLMGPEPAYQAAGRSGVDFFEVRTPEEALAALKRLKEEPGLFQSMVDHGLERRGEFSVEATTDAWERLLRGPIARNYERWVRRSKARRVITDLARFPYRALRHKRERRVFRRSI